MLKLAYFLVIIACNSCGGSEDYDQGESPQIEIEPIKTVETKPEPTVLDCPKGTNLTYDNFGEGFLLNYCTMCHSSALDLTRRVGAPIEVNFDSADDAALWRASILVRVDPKATAPMPPAANIDPTEQALMLEWLNCGAPAGSR